jgi:hypothetical protein
MGCAFSLSARQFVNVGGGLFNGEEATSRPRLPSLLPRSPYTQPLEALTAEQAGWLLGRLGLPELGERAAINGVDGRYLAKASQEDLAAIGVPMQNQQQELRAQLTELAQRGVQQAALRPPGVPLDPHVGWAVLVDALGSATQPGPLKSEELALEAVCLVRDRTSADDKAAALPFLRRLSSRLGAEADQRAQLAEALVVETMIAHAAGALDAVIEAMHAHAESTAVQEAARAALRNIASSGSLPSLEELPAQTFRELSVAEGGGEGKAKEREPQPAAQPQPPARSQVPLRC